MQRTLAPSIEQLGDATVIRSRFATLDYGLNIWVVLATPASVAVGALIDGWGASTPWFLVLASILVVLAFAVVRVRRVALVVGPSRIEIRGMFRTVALAPESVSGFEAIKARRWVPYLLLDSDLGAGAWRKAHALCVATVDGDQHLAKATFAARSEDLERVSNELQDAGSASSGHPRDNESEETASSISGSHQREASMPLSRQGLIGFFAAFLPLELALTAFLIAVATGSFWIAWWLWPALILAGPIGALTGIVAIALLLWRPEIVMNRFERARRAC